MALITYADKVTMNENASVPAINKVRADDMNEIKSVVNENAIRDVITAYLTSDITISTGGAYVDIPLNGSLSSGTKLTLNNNGIVIGSGITKVIISAKITLPSNKMTTGGKNVVIRKNGNIVDRNWLAISATGNNNLVLPSKLIDVQQGDVLKLGYYGSANDGIQGGAFTQFTVEAIEYSN